MFAVQFDADIKDRTITIPSKEASMLPKKVRVIILADAEEPRPNSLTFDAIKIKTKGLHFSREEANER